jgi:magnesium-transporting ATPase (P-type)
MKKIPTASWPPIIRSDVVSRWIRVRDITLTVGAWLIIGFTIHNLLWLIFDYLSEPIFQLTTVAPPNWSAIWRKMSWFVYIALSLVAWISLLAALRSNIIKSTKYIKTLPASVEMKELEKDLGVLPADIEHWHELRSVQVFVNSDNRVYKIIPTQKG